MRSKIDLVELEAELKKRLALPSLSWNLQTDRADAATSFIYQTQSWDALLHRLEHEAAGWRYYAINRWFNFWSAMGVEAIFASQPYVQPAVNEYDRLVDFSIKGVCFDHKTSVWPRKYDRSFEYAREHRDDLIRWLYVNQSREGRYHVRNRLFVVLYDSRDGEHWRLRADLGLIRDAVERYVREFDEASLVQLILGGGLTLSDVIWAVR